MKLRNGDVECKTPHGRELNPDKDIEWKKNFDFSTLGTEAIVETGVENQKDKGTCHKVTKAQGGHKEIAFKRD